MVTTQSTPKDTNGKAVWHWVYTWQCLKPDEWATQVMQFSTECLKRGSNKYLFAKTVSKVKLGMLVRDRVERIWACPWTQIPSSSELNWTGQNFLSKPVKKIKTALVLPGIKLFNTASHDAFTKEVTQFHQTLAGRCCCQCIVTLLQKARKSELFNKTTKVFTSACSLPGHNHHSWLGVKKKKSIRFLYGWLGVKKKE